MTGSISVDVVRKVYRDLARLVKNRPDASKTFKLLQADFRAPLQKGSTVEDRLQTAEKKLSFLKMTSVKKRSSGEAGRWVYKDGERLQSDDGGTFRDSKGKVVSSFDGSNLDPDSVKRHKQLLNRAGFVNNQHAKGVF